MLNVPSHATGVRIVLVDDQETPWIFMVELLQTVFGKSESEAAAFVNMIERAGRAACGPYPAEVAEVLLRAAQDCIKAHGHPMAIGAEPVRQLGLERDGHCGFCGAPAQPDRAHFGGAVAAICDDCIVAAASHLAKRSVTKPLEHAHAALGWHFIGIPQIVTNARRFPGHMRADIQVAIDRLIASTATRSLGVSQKSPYEAVTYAKLSVGGQDAVTIVPQQYHEVDIGEDQPVRCLNNALWLCGEGDLRYAVVLSFYREYSGDTSLSIEIAVPPGRVGSELTRRCFTEFEEAVKASPCYRGKVLSFDSDTDYRGKSKGIMVHRLAPVARDEVILPDATLRLLDRNVLTFVTSRERLRRLGQSTRKGILLYGPPGTGKTYTVRYLANSLSDHTTLIITAGQVGLLGSYMSLARLLQPALVVIEDVDLIGRDREQMGGPCEELLLNRLLNEMDGLKEGADILFALTTNRPEQLESALAGRPGRIDQAIEVPLPDGLGRAKLVRLYGRGLKLDDAVVQEAVRRTEGVSAAFIKEMMRRTAQSSIERDGGGAVTSDDLGEALDDMLFTGGTLNIKLLGGAQGFPNGSLTQVQAAG